MSITWYARITGVLLLLSLVAGGFGEFYVPSVMVATGDPAATAHNVTAHASLFRWGFAGYLTEAVCDVTLTFLFYVLLRPVDRNLAFYAVLLRLLATATFAFAEFFYFAALPIATAGGDLASFTSAQVDSLVLLTLNLYSYCGDLFTIFYGAGLIVIGSLIARSSFLPAVFGFLAIAGGLGFIAHNIAVVVSPALAFPWLLLPTILTMFALGLWLVAVPLDERKWQLRAAPAA